jgi:hypothetical protein
MINILAFSVLAKNWTSPVLWIHYADKHRGVCLGFDIAIDFLNEVNYIEKRAMITVGTKKASQVSEDLKEFGLRTKYNHWSYEGEFRYFVSLDDTIEDGPEKLRPLRQYS